MILEIVSWDNSVPIVDARWCPISLYAGPLESPFYPVIYLDALVVKVRDGAHVINKATHTDPA